MAWIRKTCLSDIMIIECWGHRSANIQNIITIINKLWATHTFIMYKYGHVCITNAFEASELEKNRTGQSKYTVHTGRKVFWKRKNVLCLCSFFLVGIAKKLPWLSKLYINASNPLELWYEKLLFSLTLTRLGSRSRIHERTILLRFLGIIMRILRLEVSVYNVCITNRFQITFAQGRGV